MQLDTDKDEYHKTMTNSEKYTEIYFRAHFSFESEIQRNERKKLKERISEWARKRRKYLKIREKEENSNKMEQKWRIKAKLRMKSYSAWWDILNMNTEKGEKRNESTNEIDESNQNRKTWIRLTLSSTQGKNAQEKESFSKIKSRPSKKHYCFPAKTIRNRDTHKKLSIFNRGK